MGLGVPEMMIILFLALLIFGPKKLPELGKSLGSGIREFKKASNELQRTLEEEIRLDDEKQTRRATAPALPPVIESSPETIHSPAQDAVNAASAAVNAPAAPVAASAAPTAPADTVARGTDTH